MHTASHVHISIVKHCSRVHNYFLYSVHKASWAIKVTIIFQNYITIKSKINVANWSKNLINIIFRVK